MNSVPRVTGRAFDILLLPAESFDNLRTQSLVSPLMQPGAERVGEREETGQEGQRGKH